MNRKILIEKIIKAVLFVCAAFSVALVLFMIGYMATNGYNQLITWFAYGFGNPSFPGRPLPYLFDTIYVSVGGTMIGALVGIPCAVYLAEFSSFKLRNTLKPVIEVLNGFPSIVMGMLVFVLFCNAVLTRYNVPTFSTVHGLTVSAAWLVLGIMSLPVIVSISEDSLRAVPNELREASFGLGATRWQTATKVLVPAALSGIFVSILLALLDAMGETMAVLMVIGQVTPPPITLNPLSGGNVITSVIASIVSGGETMGLEWFFGLAVLLFLMTLLMNVAVRMTKRRISRLGAQKGGT